MRSSSSSSPSTGDSSEPRERRRGVVAPPRSRLPREVLDVLIPPAAVLREAAREEEEAPLCWKLLTKKAAPEDTDDSSDDDAPPVSRSTRSRLPRTVCAAAPRIGDSLPTEEERVLYKRPLPPDAPPPLNERNRADGAATALFFDDAEDASEGRLCDDPEAPPKALAVRTAAMNSAAMRAR
mmetsp:Transcript_7445/g.30808  ORF Transcript_7445/g.30808 Transcript_7445/m.30808 type:complete len:181 (-) Transcript_7445:745-1287(-)